MAQLRERLAPSAAQQALWNAFDARVQAYLELVYREKAVSAAQGTSAPRQLAQRVDHARNRLAAMEDVEDAVRGLYASLSPEQQKTADQLLVAALPGLEAAEGDTRMSGEDRRRRPGKGEGGMRQRGGMGGAGMGGH